MLYTGSGGAVDLSTASPQELKHFMVSDAALTPEQQLHRSAWLLADAAQKGKPMSSDDLDAVLEKFSRMLSNRSDLDSDAAQFIEKEAKYELNTAPPKWLPKLMQQDDDGASEDLQDLVKGSQLNAKSNMAGQDLSSASTDSPAPPSKPLVQVNPDADLEAITSLTASRDAAAAATADKDTGTLTAARERDIEMQLDPTLADAFDTELWPMPGKKTRKTGMVHIRCLDGWLSCSIT